MTIEGLAPLLLRQRDVVQRNQITMTMYDWNFVAKRRFSVLVTIRA